MSIESGDNTLPLPQGGPEPNTQPLTPTDARLPTVVEPTHPTRPTVPAPLLPEPPPVVPGYEIFEELGRGGMGVVFRARHTTLKRPNAIKVVLSTASSRDAARFVAEAEAVAAVEHENVVRVFEYGDIAGRAYLVMEFVAGDNLHEKRLDVGRFVPREAAALVAQIARGVQAAHSAGVVHRDIKPANVLIDGSGRPKLTDFGLAKRLGGADITVTSSLLGTPSWMSPEQAAGNVKLVGIPTDIWALGVILHECLAGELPFQGLDWQAVLYQVINAEPKSVRDGIPDLCPDLERILGKCLEKKIDDRYASARLLADDLEAWLRGDPISLRPPTRGERAIRWVQRHPGATRQIALAGLAAVVILGISLKYRWDIHEAGERQRIADVETRLTADKLDLAVRAKNAQKFGSFLTQARNHRLNARPGWTWAARREIESAVALPHDAALDGELRDEYVASLTAPDAAETARWELPAQSEDSRYLAAHPTLPLLAAAQFGFGLIGSDLGQHVVYLLDTETGAHATLHAPIDPFNPAPEKRKESVAGLAFSPDGRWLTMTTRGGRLHRWNFSGAGVGPAVTLPGKGNGGPIAFSPDSRRMYVRAGRSLRVWDAVAWKPLAERELKGTIVSIVPVPATDRLAVVTGGKVLFLDPYDLSEVSAPLDAAGWSDLNAASDGRTALLADGPQIAVVDLHSGRRAGTLDFRPVPGAGLTFPHPSPDGRFAVISNASRRVLRVYDLCSGRRLFDLPIPERAENPPLAFSPDSRTLYVSGRNCVHVYSLAGGGRTVAAQPFPVSRIAASADGRSLFSASGYTVRPGADIGELGAWSAASGALRSSRPLDFGGSDCLFTSLVTQPGGWVAGGANQNGYAWNPADGGFVRYGVPETRSAERPQAFGPGGRLWLGRDRATEFAFPAMTPTGAVFADPVGLLKHNEPPASVLLGGRSGLLCANGVGRFHWLGAAGKSVSQWDEALDPFALGIRVAVTAVALSPDERFVLVGMASGAARVFRLADGERVAAWQAHGEAVSAACWVGGGVVATGSGDRTVSLRRLGTDPPTRLLTIPTAASVRDLACVDGGSLAVLEADARSVNVFDLPAMLETLCSQNLGLADAGLPAALAPVPETEAAAAAPGFGMRANYYSITVDAPYILAHLLTRCEADPGADWKGGSPHTDVRTDQFLACYRGWLTAPKPGKYKLIVDADDDAKVFLDGVPVGTASPGKKEIDLELTALPHRLRIEYRVVRDSARLKVRWSQAGGFAERPLGEAVRP